MRIRNVKPEFYRSDDVDRLSWTERFFFIALFSYVDDNGVGRDREVDICADLFAGDFSVDPTETLGRVRQCLLALVEGGQLVRYEVEGKRFLFITGWDSHQYVKNPNKDRYPRPDKALLRASVDAGETRSTSSGDDGDSLPTVVGSRSCVVGSGLKEPKSESLREPDREDSRQILNCLDEALAGNNFQTPTRSQGNLRAARLLIDTDGYTIEQIEWVIHWCQRDQFWAPNIRSMSKLREKFPQLVAKAKAGSTTKTSGIDWDAAMQRAVERDAS